MRQLTCFAHGKPGDWEAVCLDFDLSVQGETFEDVQQTLIAAINDYVLAARDEDEKTRAKLLNRKAPFWVKAQWLGGAFLFAVLSILRRSGDGDNASAQFPVACPA